MHKGPQYKQMSVFMAVKMYCETSHKNRNPANCLGVISHNLMRATHKGGRANYNHNTPCLETYLLCLFLRCLRHLKEGAAGAFPCNQSRDRLPQESCLLQSL